MSNDVTKPAVSTDVSPTGDFSAVKTDAPAASAVDTEKAERARAWLAEMNAASAKNDPNPFVK